MSCRPFDHLAIGYEALRVQALGDSPADSPRGRAILLDQGMPAWIRAWATPPAVPVAPASTKGRSDVGPGSEIVRLLAEMALGGRRAMAGAR